MKPRIDFWYDLASGYSYLAAMRIAALADAADVTVRWRPFLLGPIFKTMGLETSPFVIYEAKGRYMRRDLERLAEARGLPFTMPDKFPAFSVYAARLVLAGAESGLAEALTREIFLAEYARGEDISDPEILADIADRAGGDAQTLMRLAASPAVKTRLREETGEAIKLELFGAPAFTTEDGELFWGDDRLPQALAWAAQST